MKSKEITRYSKNLLKGRRTVTSLICLLPVFAEIFIRFTEASAYSLLLYFCETPPVSLFTGKSTAQTAVAVTGGIIRLVSVSPLLFASAKRLCEICSESGRVTPFADVITDRRFLAKSISASMLSKAIGLFALVPAILFGITAYSLIVQESKPEITFMGVNACILSAISVCGWISVKITLSALPFMMYYFPEKNIFSLTVYTVKFMNSRKMSLLKLGLTNLAGLLAVFPYKFPEFMTSISLSISIYVKEDEYSERNRIESGTGKTYGASKISHRKKRRFTPSADEAQTAGAGDNV